MNNVDLKAVFTRTIQTDDMLREMGAEFQTVENQIDIFYRVEDGFLKIRERSPGEPQLIQYFRDSEKAPRLSRYTMVRIKNCETVKSIMEREHGILVVVKKKREIWIWENIRIHFDEVEQLGQYLELIAVLKEYESPAQSMKKVVNLMKRLNISRGDLVGESYAQLVKQI